MMKRWKEKAIAAGLNPKKELLVCLLFVLLCLAADILLYLKFALSFYLLVPLLFGVIFVYFYLNRYRGIEARKQNERMEEFVKLFTFFGVYIQDGFNVYNALEAIMEFASPDMKELLSALLGNIEEDKSVEPYVAFAAKFPDISVRQVMLSIYQMVDEGQGGVYIRQFERLFAKLSDQKHALEKEKWKDRLSTLAVLPLVGSGLATITLSLSLMNIMEDSLNGL